MKKLFAVVGVLLVLTGAYFTFRRAAPLSDEAAISRELDSAEAALEARSAARVTQLLAKDFRTGDTGRKDFNTMLAANFWQWRDVELTRNGEKIAVTGDNATVTGNYAFRFRPSEGAPYEMHGGLYTLQLRRDEGQWKVVSASSSEGNMQ
jgi:ketosteroid isomerase-like protein